MLVYDLQEVGGRTWTYVSTMALSMQAAAKRGIPFVVLDRPNPIGGEIVEGALLDPAFKSFVGMYPIPARHGMTVGELATLFNQQHGIGADLIVVQGGELAAIAVARRHRAAVGEPVAEPAVARRAHQLSGHGLLRGHQPDRRPRHRPAVRADRRAVAARARGRRGDERAAAARRPLRGDHDAGREDGGEVPGRDDPGHPLRRHRSPGLPPGAHRAAADRHDQAAPARRSSRGVRRSIG